MRRTPKLAALVALALVASACLGPGQFDPTGRAPIGNLEVMVDAAGSIRVSGWALDPETSAPIVVKVGSEGVVHDVLANGNRPDVAAAYPGYGAAHGFEHTFGPLSPELHGICVWVPNTVGGGDDRLLGCKNLVVSDPNPRGNLDVVTSLAARTIDVGGWVFDPNSAGSAEVAITVDGQFAKRMAADGYRPDVGKAYRRNPSTGFATQLAAVPGTHQVCVGVFNIGYGQDRLLGCRNVTVADVAQDRRPSGRLTEVTPLGGGQVRVRGTASDPDGATGLKVRLAIDAGTRSMTLPVTGGAFSTTLTGLADGHHTICPVGIDVPGGAGVTGNRPFLCGSTVLGDVSVGTAGATSSPKAVAPPPNNPLRLTDRDAGVSVELRDGSVMWFFGDTRELDQVGNLKYFVNNTAAWAAAGAPTVTRDAVSGGKPYPFVRSSDYGDFCNGASYPNEAMWPESAVAVPQANGTDRVVVFMSKVCLGNQFLQIEGRGMALAEYTYNPNNKPVDREIRGAITQPNLFGVDEPYGRGAVLSDDNSTIYTYQCGRFPPLDDPCKVGRVPVASRTNPGAWKYWNGGDWQQSASWVSNPASAAPMTTPTAQGITVPVSAFTLTYDDAHGAYLMVYSPWPGFTDRVVVRVATTPVGPWTEPVEVFLPGCGESNGGAKFWCYAGTAQPKLSGPGLLGIGYYDQLVSVGPTRGQYLTVTVPFRVVIAPG